MTPLKITPLPGCTPGTAEKIDALNHKLGSFIHAPLNLKEILRMEPFAADTEVAWRFSPFRQSRRLCGICSCWRAC